MLRDFGIEWNMQSGNWASLSVRDPDKLPFFFPSETLSRLKSHDWGYDRRFNTSSRVWRNKFHCRINPSRSISQTFFIGLSVADEWFGSTAVKADLPLFFFLSDNWASVCRRSDCFMGYSCGNHTSHAACFRVTRLERTSPSGDPFPQRLG